MIYIIKLLLALLVFLQITCIHKHHDSITALGVLVGLSGSSSDSSTSTSSSSSSDTTSTSTSTTSSSSSSTGSTTPTLTKISSGETHSCALFSNHKVKCWGKNNNGQLGYGHTNNYGDNETLDSIGYVNIGADVSKIDVGNFTCILTTSGSVKCWGVNDEGCLGITSIARNTKIGDDEDPSSIGYINLGSGTISDISVGFDYACALFSDGSVICWGQGYLGRLGYGDENDIGDDETPISKGSVPIGGTVSKIYAGYEHTCAILTDGNVRCWGNGTYGRLGYENTTTLGDNEAASTGGNINLGASRTATQLALNVGNTCAILDNAKVKCWGYNSIGQLGLGYYGTNASDYVGNGVGTSVSTVSTLDFGSGRTASSISANKQSTCAVLDNDTIMCWGENDDGELGDGSGNGWPIGGFTVPSGEPALDMGSFTPKEVALGYDISCAMNYSASVNSSVKCWGRNTNGELGQGNTTNVGLSTKPSTINPIVFLSSSQLTGYLAEYIQFTSAWIVLVFVLFIITIMLFFKIFRNKRYK